MTEKIKCSCGSEEITTPFNCDYCPENGDSCLECKDLCDFNYCHSCGFYWKDEVVDFQPVAVKYLGNKMMWPDTLEGQRGFLLGMIEYDKAQMLNPERDRNWFDGRVAGYENIIGAIDIAIRARDGKY